LNKADARERGDRIRDPDIVNQPDIQLHLTAWASDLVTIPSNFADQNTEALKTIALIDAELQRR
jgi:hypothetical protein